ncbi:MAG: toxin-antitoxin system HicB family antitoxin [Anaerolineales bacterium]|nr:toxin-antitoxin system HicB family antitoxin [Anaerolineales bacterium]
MLMENDRYTYRVIWSEGDGEYAGLCAEFPSLSWLAGEPEEVLRGIRRVVEEVVADLENNEEPLPEPISTKRFSGKFMVRIAPELHRRLMLEGAEAGISMNRLESDKLSRVE